MDSKKILKMYSLLKLYKTVNNLLKSKFPLKPDKICRFLSKPIFHNYQFQLISQANLVYKLINLLQ